MSADSYTAGATDTPLIEDTIDANFCATVAAHGDREALVVRHQGIRWTYNELDAHVDQLARALFASGLNVGDRVALWSPNRYEWVLAQYATARIGAIMVCINPAYRTHELEFRTDPHSRPQLWRPRGDHRRSQERHPSRPGRSPRCRDA